MLELLLVLAVAVAIAAIAMPAIEAPMQNQRLRKGADQVRAALATARNRAMKNGVTYVCRYEVGGRQLVIEPRLDDSDSVELTQSSALGGAAMGLNGGAAPVGGNSSMPMMGPGMGGSQLGTVTITLPDRISFFGGDVLADQRSASLETEMLNVSGGLLSSSRPIFFYADGTTSDAIVLVGSERGKVVRVELRGLTGLSRTSEVLAADEVTP